MLVYDNQSAVLIFLCMTGSVVPMRRFPIVQRSKIIRSSFCPLISMREGACFGLQFFSASIFLAHCFVLQSSFLNFDELFAKEECPYLIEGYAQSIFIQY